MSESLPTARLLLLVNYRPDYRHGWGSKTYYTQVRLDPLPPASADAFLRALLGDDPSLTPLTQLLIQRTEGNPFFLEESVRALVETGALVGEPGGYRVAQDLPTLQVPATVRLHPVSVPSPSPRPSGMAPSESCRSTSWAGPTMPWATIVEP